MPIIKSSRVLYRWLLPVVLGALVYRLLVWCGAIGYVSGLRDAAASHKPFYFHVLMTMHGQTHIKFMCMTFEVLMVSGYRHSTTCTTIMFWKVQYKSNFMQVTMEYTYGQLCRYVQGSPVEIKTLTCRSLVGYRVPTL